ncbi:DUF4192 family protein [Streptomyces chartreusis]
MTCTSASYICGAVPLTTSGTLLGWRCPSRACGDAPGSNASAPRTGARSSRPRGCSHPGLTCAEGRGLLPTSAGMFPGSWRSLVGRGHGSLLSWGCSPAPLRCAAGGVAFAVYGSLWSLYHPHRCVFQFSVAGRELGFAEVLPDARDTARLITGLKDRRTRDFALACDDQRAAHRLWQHLARRCVTPPTRPSHRRR